MLEIRLMGELQVLREEQPVAMPASRKSRALLAYLVSTGKQHLRERLCELLWEGPDDPRAALRWSLAKLRPLVEPHLIATRDRVGFEEAGATIDLRRLCVPAAATIDSLEECAALFRGDFLEGLDLPACYRYQQWCAGERERLRQSHLAILTELTRRHGPGERALHHARRRVTIDPFNDQAHASLIQVLAALDQNQEALRHYERCRELFQRELGTRPGTAVENARRLIGAQPRTSRPEPAAPVHSSSAFVGRTDELAQIETSGKPVLLIGEPGIGKSRILEELRVRSSGPTVYGRAFAAEMVRPYGVWIEALPGFPAENDRVRLFEAVVQRLEGIALIALDDLQWIDESAAALLHYVARHAQSRIVCTARAGEVDDNPYARQLMRDLDFLTLAVGPLSAGETRSLVRDELAAQRSGGNPLFALELARSGVESGASPVTALIAGRLAALSGPARELVAWAAAVGHQFDIETVGRATGMPAGEMLAALEKLERSAIIRPAGDRHYDFVHDLVRDAAYQMITGPRRTLVHRHIARALRETHDADGALAGDIVHHASLAGERQLACAAAVEAGKRCLRLFAYVEATNVARRGLQIAESLMGNERLEVEMRLLSVIVMSRVPVRERLPFAAKIATTIEQARQAGLGGTAGLGAHLLASMYEETNHYREAADATIQSAESSRTADPAIAALSMATSARCLLVLQRDIAHAERLLLHAAAIGSASPELPLGLGYLRAHQGRAAEAAEHLERALAIASQQQDHWREWVALSRLVTLALEQGDPGLALRQCARLNPVAGKMHGGSERARSDVLEAVARHALGEAVDLDVIFERLHEIDSKSDVAWVLSYLAGIEADPERARRFATEALAAAETVGRDSEAVIARIILGQPAKATRDISARARALLKEKRHGRPRTRAVV